MLRISHLIFFLLICSLTLDAAKVDAANAGKPSHAVYAIRIPALAKDEAVTRFEVKINNGGVESISGLPKGWGVVIDNDASWICKTSGGIMIGAAALTREQLQGIQFHLIKNGIDFLEFGLSGSITTFIRPDIEKERDRDLKAENFEIVNP